jgi:hypothetical protein
MVPERAGVQRNLKVGQILRLACAKKNAVLVARPKP